MRKHQPWKREVELILRWIRDTGHMTHHFNKLVPPEAMDSYRYEQGKQRKPREKLQVFVLCFFCNDVVISVLSNIFRLGPLTYSSIGVSAALL